MFKSYACLLLVIACFLCVSGSAQNVISGNVKNGKTNDAVAAVSILIKGSGQGTFTDDKGNFKITTSEKLPVTLILSSIGYADKEVTVSNSETVNITLETANGLAQDVVVSASRLPERILESPVSIERVNSAAIRNAASPSYYDVIGRLKGVDITTSSFGFKTPSTRGFNGSGNLRLNQLVDGMDNQAPALNFAVGSIIGLTELDVDNMELLPGASSALYGSGGMNGTLLINSKSPFQYQGLSWQVKQGINHVDNYERNPAPFYDWSLRYAKKVSEKFAFKIGGQFIQAQDWQANDTRNLLRNNVVSSLKDGDRTSDPNYDGVNVFGDEASASMNALAQAVKATLVQGGGQPIISALDGMLSAGLTPPQAAAQFMANPTLVSYTKYLPFLIPTSSVANNPYRNTFAGQFPVVSRTGYNENALVDYNSYNVRLSAGLNYKITNDIEASFLGY